MYIFCLIQFAGMCFGDVWYKLKDAILVGIRSSEGSVTMSPSDATVIQQVRVCVHVSVYMYMYG
jgi:hypothetical protein